MNVWTGIIAGAIALTVYGLSRLNKDADQLVTEIKGRIHSVDFSKIVLAIDATLKNPTTRTWSIHYPFIRISYQGKEIATSEMIDKFLKIAPLSQTAINDVRIPVSYIKLGGIALDLVKKIQNKEKITLQVTVQTTVNTGIGQINYTDTQDVVLYNADKA